MFFDGRKFTNNGHPHSFTFDNAMREQKRLREKFPILSRYKIWLKKIALRVASPRNNPESVALEEAAHKLEEFSGHPAKHVLKVNQPETRQGLVIGELRVLEYVTKREGINRDKLTRWAHTFRKKSRPLLAVSKDGKQLLIVGGRYEFTEAGIEDR